VDRIIASLPFNISASTGKRLKSNSLSLKSNDNGSTLIHLAIEHPYMRQANQASPATPAKPFIQPVTY
jgi:hypothetical protein